MTSKFGSLRYFNSARISGKTEVTTGDRVEHAGERESQAAQVRASEAKEQQLRAKEVQAKVKETQAREEEARTQKAKETSERRLKEAADRQVAVELKIPPAHLSFSDK